MADNNPGDASSGKKPVAPQQHGRWRRLLLSLTLGLALLLAAGAALGTWYALSIEKSVTQNITRQDNTLPGENDPERPAKPSTGPQLKAVNYVLLGSDDDSAGSSRSDSLMVLHLNADRDAAYIVSFPRDMWVDIPGRGKAKINAAYAWGGSKLTVQTLEKLLNVRIDHVAIIDFEGFIKLTDDLGGVTVFNKHYSKSGGCVFPKGKITIRGEEALAYVRERKQLPGGDLDRAERHRSVVQAILRKGMSKETIANPAKFTAFVGGVAKHLTVDPGLTDREIRKTAVSLRLTGNDVTLLQAPIKGFATSADGQSIDVVNEPRLAELAEALRDDTMADYVQRYPSS